MGRQHASSRNVGSGSALHQKNKRRAVERAIGPVLEDLEQRMMLTVATPSNLVANPPQTPSSGTSMIVLWRDNANNETHFDIERSTDGINFSSLASVNANIQAYEDTTASSGPVWYRVQAGNDTEHSAYSSVAQTTAWTSANIGTVTGGSWNVNSGTLTIVTKGGGFSGTADDGRMVYTQITGDATIITRVASVQNTNPLAKAGIMFRNSLAANSRNVFLAITPSGSAQWQRRPSDGASTDATSISSRSAPQWAKLVREGSRFTAYLSTDGTSWTQVGQQNVNMNATLYVGLALSSSGYGADNTSTFTNIEASWQDHALPVNWSSQDVGSASFAGSARYYDGNESPAFTFAVEASGQNVGGTSDTFHFARRSFGTGGLSGDGEFVARVASVQNNGYNAAKAGIMLRDGMAADARNVFLAISAGSGAVWQYRSTAGQNTTETWSSGKSAPYWLKITRVGNTFTGYLSTDGSTWSPIGSAVTISGMSASLEVGLALSAAGYGSLNTSTFDNVKFTPAVPVLSASAVHGRRIDLSWTCATGSSSVSGYLLQRSDNGGSTWSDVGGEIHATAFVDDTVSPEANYQYRVKAYIDDLSRGESAWSTVASASTVGLGDGLTATYWNNADFTGISTTRVDPAVLFDWSTGSPDTGIDADTFAVEWKGQIKPQFSETYTFYTYSDDGVRLWVNNQLLINQWSVQSPTEHSATIALTAGQLYNIRIEYFDNYSNATMHLSWSSASQAKEIVPTARLFSNTGGGGTSLDTPVLSASRAVGTAINLSWSVITGASIYELWQSNDGGASYSPLATLMGSTSYSDVLATDASRSYRLVAIGAAGRSSFAFASVSAITASWNNLGFESPALGANSSQQAPTNAGWTFSSNSGIAANGSSITTGAPNAPEGTQVAYLGPNSQIVQYTPLVAGYNNVLHFRATLAPGSTTSDPFWVQLGSSSWSARTSFQPGSGSYVDLSLGTVGGGTQYPFEPVQFEGSSGGSTWLIDDVRMGLYLSAPTLSFTSDGVTIVNANPAATESPFSIERSQDNGATWQTVATVLGNGATALDDTVGSSAPYRYRFNVNGTVSDATSITTGELGFYAPMVSEPNLGTVELSWSNWHNATSYTVERSANGGAFVGIATLTWDGQSPLSYSDAYVSPNTPYSYRIRTGGGAVSSSTSVLTREPFAAPVLSYSDGVVQISWNNHGSSGSYIVERSTDGTGFSMLGGTLSGTSTEDRSTLSGTTYYYRIHEGSEYSEVSAITVSVDPLGAPAVSILSPYATRIRWTIPSNSGTSNVRVLRNGTPVEYSGTTVFSGSSGWIDDIGLNPQTTYEYCVEALDGTLLGQSSAATPIRTPNIRPLIRVGASAARAVAGRDYVLRVAYQSVVGANTIGSLRVDWGDGNPAEIISGTPDTIQHIYATSGQYSITVTPLDQDTEASLMSARVGYDSKFGSNGVTVTDLQNASDDDAAAVAQDWQGRLLVAATDITHGRFVLLRYNLDGTLDTTFGSEATKTGKAFFDFGSNGSGQHYEAHASSLTIDGQGRIYVAGDVRTPLAGGDYDYDLAVARFNPDGTRDSVFGDARPDGYFGVITDFGSQKARANAIAYDGSTGDIVLAGYADGWMALARYNEDGSLDTSFGDVEGGQQSGKTLVNLSTRADIAYAVKFDAQRRIVVAGRSGQDMAVLRFHADGTADTSFGTEGISRINVDVNDFAYDLDFDLRGRIVVAGSANGFFALARLTEDGLLDTTFSGDGVMTDTRSDGSYFWRVVVGTDGSITAGGNTAVARYLADGSTDNRFGEGGLVEWYDNGQINTIRALSMFFDDEGITLVGQTANGNGDANVAIMRLLTDHRLTVVGTAPEVTMTPPSTPPGGWRAGDRYTLGLLAQQGASLDAIDHWVIHTGEVDITLPGNSTAATFMFFAGGVHQISADAYGQAGDRYAAVVSGTTDVVLPVQVIPSMTGGADTVPPSLTGSITLGPTTPSSVYIQWTPATGDVSYYTVTRTGGKTWQRTTANLLDTDVAAGTAYTYTVRAYDAAGNPSTASYTVNVTVPSTDTTPPVLSGAVTAQDQNGANGMPGVKLTWLSATDNSNTIDHYEVARDGVFLARMTGGPYVDSDVPSGQHTYSITAVDAARNRSTTLQVTWTASQVLANTDNAPDQYIPQNWKDAFYNTLVPALRQRYAMLPATIMGQPVPMPFAQGWYDGEQILIPKASGTSNWMVPAAPPVRFVDHNGNGWWEPGEFAWINQDTDPDYTVGDTIVGSSSWIPAVDTPGRFVVGMLWMDLDGDSELEPSERYSQSSYMLRGQSSTARYFDADASGTLDTASEPVWLDQNANNVYDLSDKIIADPLAMLTSPLDGKIWGKSFGLLAGGDVNNDNEPDFYWVDDANGGTDANSQFRADLANFYTDVEALAPTFRRLGDDPAARWDVPSLIETVVGSGATRAGSGTLTWNSGTVMGAGTLFTQQLHTGDWIKDAAGNAAQVQSVNSDTRLELGNLDIVDDDAASVSFNIYNWTRTPADTANGLRATYGSFGKDSPFAFGSPASPLITPTHLDELKSALNCLTTLPDIYDLARYDQDSSEAMVDAVVDALNVWDAIKPQDPVLFEAESLRQELQAGLLDPGALRKEVHVRQLRELIDEIGSLVYERSSAPSASDTNYWAVEDGFDSTLAWHGGGMKLLDFEWAELAGNHSISAADVGELTTALSRIASNQLWIDAGTVSGSTLVNDSTKLNYLQASFPSLSGYGTDFTGSDLIAALNPGAQTPQAGAGVNSGFDFLHSVDASGDVAQFSAAIDYNPIDYVEPAPTAFAFGTKATVGLPYGTRTSGPEFLEFSFGPDAISPAVSGSLWPSYVDQQQNSVIHQVVLCDFTATGMWALLQQMAGTTTRYHDATTGLYVWSQYTHTNGVSDRTDVVVSFSLRNVLFGRVDPSTALSHVPVSLTPPDLTIGALALDPLKLGSEMAALNTVQDTDLDDLVEVDHDQVSFGNDSGVIQFQAQRDRPQVYLPLFTDQSGALPVHGYLVQGGFGADNGPQPFSRDLSSPFANEAGLSVAYSLNTQVRTSLLLNDAANHIKRMEVIRPRGNAVIFDFPWDGQKFSDTGVPIGREAKRLYVLRQDQTGYHLLFPSGVIHNFNADTGKLESISHIDGRSVSSWSGGPQAPSTSTASAATFGVSTSASTRYDQKLTWLGGRIASVEYKTRETTGAKKITTQVSYAGTGAAATIKSLDKFDDASNPIAPFSYTFDPSANSIVNGSVTVTRAVSTQNGAVTLTRTIGPVLGSYAVQTTFNDAMLVSQRKVTLDPGGGAAATTATTNIQYTTAVPETPTSSDRYTANQSPKWGKVEKIESVETGTWEEFTYGTNTGWVSTHSTPFGGQSYKQVESYTYTEPDGELASGQNAVRPWNLVERPRDIKTTANSIEIGHVMVKYINNGAGTLTTISRVSQTAGATWASAPPTKPNLESTSTLQVSTNSRTGTTSSVLGTSTTTFSQESDGRYTLSSQSKGASGTVVQSSSSTYNAFGYLASGTSWKNGIQLSNISSTASASFGFGRIGDYYNTVTATGTKQSYSATDWFGPHQTEDENHIKTDLAYKSWGAPDTQTVFSGSGHAIKSSFDYDSAGDVILTGTYTPTTGGGFALAFNAEATYDVHGRPTRSVDADGRITTTSYTLTGGKLVADTTLPGGQHLINQYNPDGSIASQSGNGTYPASYEYSVSAEGVQVKSSMNNGKNWSTSSLNMLGQVWKSTQPGPQGKTTQTATQSFDTLGRPSQFTDFDGGQYLTQYNDNEGYQSDQIVDINKNGQYDPGTDRNTSYSSAFRQGPSTIRSGTISGDYLEEIVTVHGGPSPATPDSVFATHTSLDGLKTVSQQYAAHAPNPTQGLTSTSVATRGTEQDEQGVVTAITTVTDTAPNGATTTSTYRDGLLTNVLRTGGIDIKYDYDNLRRLQTVTDHVFDSLSYTYTNAGLVKSVSQGSGSSLRSWSVGTDANTGQELRDPNTGMPLSIVRPDGRTFTQHVNDQGQIDQISGAGVFAQKYGFDAQTGQLATLTTYQSGTINGTGAATTTWKRDPYTGAVTQKDYATQTAAQTVQYRADGQVDYTTNGGLATNSSYSAFPESTGYKAGDQSLKLGPRDAKGQVWNWTYKVEGTNAASYTNQVSYDNHDRVQLESVPGLANAVLKTTYYTDNEKSTGEYPGAVKTRTLEVNGNAIWSRTYTYDMAGRVYEVKLADNVKYTYGYKSGTDLPQTLTSTGRPATVWDYDNRGRLLKLSQVDGNTDFYNTTYSYNDNDQRSKAKITYTPYGGSSQDFQWRYDYHFANADQLKSAGIYTNDEASTPTQEFTYTFDGIGNRTDRTYTPNLLNQYTTNPDAAGAAMTYDARGNLTDDGRFTFEYDSANRLIRATTRAPVDGEVGRVEMGYDESGRRIWKKTLSFTDNTWIPAQTRQFAYDGWNLIAEFEPDGQGGVQLLATYAWGVHGPGGGVGALLSITTYTAGGQVDKTYQPLFDGSGNVMGLVDAGSGIVVASYRYDPFGNILSQTGDAAALAANHFGFATKYRDVETGLSYFGYRYYSPPLNRWLTPDPLQEAGGLNRDAYCGNDPVNAVDPLGLEEQVFRVKDEHEVLYNLLNEKYKPGDIYLDGPGRFQSVGQTYVEGPAWWRYIIAPSSVKEKRRERGKYTVFVIYFPDKHDNEYAFKGADQRRAEAEHALKMIHVGAQVFAATLEAFGVTNPFVLFSQARTPGINAISNREMGVGESIFTFAPAALATVGKVASLANEIKLMRDAFNIERVSVRTRGLSAVDYIAFGGPKNFINPTGCRTNCANVSIATEHAFRGEFKLARALPSGAKDLQTEVGIEFGIAGCAKANNSFELETSLRFSLQNNGDSLFIAAMPEEGVGHALNAINHQGTIYIVDNQLNIRFPMNSFDNFFEYFDPYSKYKVIIPKAGTK